MKKVPFIMLIFALVFVCTSNGFAQDRHQVTEQINAHVNALSDQEVDTLYKEVIEEAASCGTVVDPELLKETFSYDIEFGDPATFSSSHSFNAQAVPLAGRCMGNLWLSVPLGDSPVNTTSSSFPSGQVTADKVAAITQLLKDLGANGTPCLNCEACTGGLKCVPTSLTINSAGKPIGADLSLIQPSRGKSAYKVKLPAKTNRNNNGEAEVAGFTPACECK